MKLVVEIQVDNDLLPAPLQVFKFMESMGVVLASRYGNAPSAREVFENIPKYEGYGAIITESRHKTSHEVMFRAAFVDDDVNSEAVQTDTRTESTGFVHALEKLRRTIMEDES